MFIYVVWYIPYRGNPKELTNMTHKIIETRDGFASVSHGDAEAIRDKLYRLMTSNSRQHYLEIEKDGKKIGTHFDNGMRHRVNHNDDGTIEHVEFFDETVDLNLYTGQIRYNRLHKKITDEEIAALAENMSAYMIEKVS